MRMYNSIALALISATLATIPCSAQNDADLQAQVHVLQQQAAALTQQIQILQRKIDQKADPLQQASASNTTDSKMAPYVEASATGIPQVAANSNIVASSEAKHGYFERKPGDRMTFYVPGGEFTAYGNLDLS